MLGCLVKLIILPIGLEIGYIQCQCSGNNISDTATDTLYAEAGKGSFCCGTWKYIMATHAELNM